MPGVSMKNFLLASLVIATALSVMYIYITMFTVGLILSAAVLAFFWIKSFFTAKKSPEE